MLEVLTYLLVTRAGVKFPLTLGELLTFTTSMQTHDMLNALHSLCSTGHRSCRNSGVLLIRSEGSTLTNRAYMRHVRSTKTSVKGVVEPNIA